MSNEMDNMWEGMDLLDPRKGEMFGVVSAPKMTALPEDIETEKAYLATIFAPGADDLAMQAQDHVRPEYFSAPQHRLLFEAGIRLANAGCQISPQALRDEMGAMAPRMGGFTGIVDLLGNGDYLDPAPLGRIIRSKWEARTAILMLTRASRTIEQDGVVGSSLNGLSELLGALEPQQEKIVGHADLFDMAASGTALMPTGMASNLPSFGIESLDLQLNATARRFGVIAAKTSAGKSSMAYQICLKTCAKDRRVLLVSLESDPEEVTAAIAANMGELNRSKIMLSGTNGFDSGVLELVKRNFAAYYASSGSSWDSIERAIRAEHRRRPFSVVIVDYFTLLQPPEYKGRNMASMYGEISKAGKRLAQELECSVIFLSQFNRGVEDGAEPFLENLRETGQLEQDADWVMLMWANPDDEPDGTRIVHAKGAKNRGGKRNFKCRMTFWPEQSRFEERIYETEECPTIKKKRRMS